MPLLICPPPPRSHSGKSAEKAEKIERTCLRRRYQRTGPRLTCNDSFSFSVFPPPFLTAPHLGPSLFLYPPPSPFHRPPALSIFNSMPPLQRNTQPAIFAPPARFDRQEGEKEQSVAGEKGRRVGNPPLVGQKSAADGRTPDHLSNTHRRCVTRGVDSDC